MSDDLNERPMTEAEWEALFRKSDVKAAKFQELLETLGDEPGSDVIIAREMGWTRLADALERDAAQHPDEPDEEWPDTSDDATDKQDSSLDVDDDDDESWLEDDFDDFDGEGDEDDDEAGEEWKQRRNRLRAIPAYRAAMLLGKRILEALRPFMEAPDVDDDLGQLLGEASISVHQAAAKIAGGHAMGYDDDVLCGNIVNNRIALDAVKRSQQAWAELQELQIVPPEMAEPLVAEMREVERLLEERIAELRSRVWW
jgi:hypothetical protein